MTPPTDWMARSACKGKPELFYAPSGTNSGSVAFDYGPALALCRDCPVARDCRAWAIDAEEIDGKGRAVHGVVAGLAPSGPVRLGRPRADSARCGTHSGYVTHQKRGEPACRLCTVAKREYSRRYMRKTRAS